MCRYGGKFLFSIENKGKETVFKDILINELKIWKESLKAIAIEIDNRHERLSIKEIENLNKEMLIETSKKICEYYKNEKYTKSEQKVLDIVIPKYCKWNEERMQSMYNAIEHVEDLNVIHNLKIKQSLIFALYNYSIVSSLLSAQNTLNEINGDLKGLTFKGIKI